MNRLTDRRLSERRAEELASPEFLRVLEICGGELRQADRIGAAGHGAGRSGTGDRRKVEGTAADRGAPAGAAPKRPGLTS